MAATTELKIDWAPRVTIEGASDATFDMAHSTSGYVIFLLGTAIAWACRAASRSPSRSRPTRRVLPVKTV